MLELCAQLALAQAEQQLLGRLLVDPFRVGTSIELGEKGERLGPERHVVDEVRAQRPARLVVKVVCG